jgi:acid phosphatase
MERPVRPIRRVTIVAASLISLATFAALLSTDARPATMVTSPPSLLPSDRPALPTNVGPTSGQEQGVAGSGGLAAPADASRQAATADVSAAATAIPAFRHIYLIVMENHEYGSIVGSTHAPFINSLIRRYGLATNYHGITHPSLPNYLALFAGQTFGIRDDGIHNISAHNLVDQLEGHGRTWHVYAQDKPSGCYTGSSHYGGVDLVGLPGYYVRKHEPAISFTDISRVARRCALVTSLSSFDPAAANFELIVPNLSNDMHDGSIAQGDTFLKAFVPRITANPAFGNSLLLITWDEGTTNVGGGGRVATIVVSPAAKAAYRSSISHNHYSLLRTIEDAWNLGCLNNTCPANDLREFFGP